MRVALIGIFGEAQDEGMRKLCAQFATAAAQKHTVLTVGTRDFGTGRAWSRLRTFRPECLHYVTGPTLRSLALLKFYRATLPGRVATIATGIRPYFGPAARRLVGTLAPDLYLAQARNWQRLFAEQGAPTMDFPHGVDRARFAPASAEKRSELRARWGLPADKPVVLHVGHVKPNRNLAALLEAQRSGRYQAWVVGSVSESRPGPWRAELESAGVRVTTQFVSRIEEVYQAADLYAFTVKAPTGEYPGSYDEVGVIDLPLSILEARACGLRVISTRHDAVRHFLGGDSAVSWFDGTSADCLRELDRLSARSRDEFAPLEAKFELTRLPAQLNEAYDRVASIRR